MKLKITYYTGQKAVIEFGGVARRITADYTFGYYVGVLCTDYDVVDATLHNGKDADGIDVANGIEFQKLLEAYTIGQADVEAYGVLVQPHSGRYYSVQCAWNELLRMWEASREVVE